MWLIHLGGAPGLVVRVVLSCTTLVGCPSKAVHCTIGFWYWYFSIYINFVVPRKLLHSTIGFRYWYFYLHLVALVWLFLKRYAHHNWLKILIFAFIFGCYNLIVPGEWCTKQLFWKFILCIQSLISWHCLTFTFKAYLPLVSWIQFSWNCSLQSTLLSFGMEMLVLGPQHHLASSSSSQSSSLPSYSSQ